MIRRIILSQTRRVCLIFGVVVILMAGCSSKTPSPISPVDNTTPFIDGNTYDNPKLKIRVTMPDTSWHMTMQEYSDLNGNTYWLAVSKRNGGALDFRSQPQGQTTGRALIQKMFWEICYTDNVYGVTPYDSTAISVDTARGLYWLDMTYYLGATLTTARLISFLHNDFGITLRLTSPDSSDSAAFDYVRRNTILY